ncbi:MAG: hypothetical protein ACI37Z_05125 [Candidatus Gastranaerophilaceae bacterium]
MYSYEVNESKRKKAIKQVVNANVKTARVGIKFCYGLTWFLRILAVLLGLGNILYVVFFSSYVLDLVFLVITFGFPYCLSFLSAIVYIISAGGEYRLRKKETITFSNGGFVYSYHDDRVGFSDVIFAFNVLYENISKIEYDDRTKMLTLHGKIIGDTYENGELKASDTYNEISLLDVYDFSLKQLLNKNC